MQVSIDGGATKEIQVGDFDTILTVKSKLVKTSDLSGDLENAMGYEVTDLYEVILQTNEDDRYLYYCSHRPPNPNYKHSHSVSHAASQKPNEIN